MSGALRSTWLSEIGPAVVQIPARSQSWRLPVAALAVSVPAATLVLSWNAAADGSASPEKASMALQARATSAACHRPSGAAQLNDGGERSSWTVRVWGWLASPSLSVAQ